MHIASLSRISISEPLSLLECAASRLIPTYNTLRLSSYQNVDTFVRGKGIGAKGQELGLDRMYISTE